MELYRTSRNKQISKRRLHSPSTYLELSYVTAKSLSESQLSSAFFFDSKALDVIGEMEVALTSGRSSRPEISRANLCSGSTRAFFLLLSFSMSGNSEMLWDCSLRRESLC